MKLKICTCCGFVGKPIPQEKSSFVVDGFIWVIMLNLAGMSQQLYLLLFPLAWTIYHIVKFNSVTCPQCKNLDMVSVSSNQGLTYMAKHTDPSRYGFWKRPKHTVE